MKEYKIKGSASTMVTRYAFSNMMADAACFAIMLGTVPLHVSADKFAVLLILYNILSIAPRALISLYADAVKNRHTGVLLGVMLIFLGFMWPFEFAVTPKVVLLGIGNAVYRSFSGSSVLAHSGFRASDVGSYIAGGVIGAAFARYVQFYCLLALPLLVFAAGPSDKAENLPEAHESRLPKSPKTALAPLFAVLLLLCCSVGSYLNYGISYPWNKGRKVMVMVAFAAALGMLVGGYLFDRLSGYMLAASLVGGTALLIFCPASRNICLLGIMLVNMAIPAVLALLFRFMPRHPGFSVSLAACFGYLGYAATHLFPAPLEDPKTALAVGGAFILLSSLASLIYIELLGKKQTAEVKTNE